MRIRIISKKEIGQNMIEYAVVFGIVTVALMGMQTYFKRSVQAVVKVAADAYSNNTQVAPIGVVEMRIKQEINKTTPLTMTSTSSSSMTQKRENIGESDIHTETSGTINIIGSSRSIAGDFREKDVK